MPDKADGQADGKPDGKPRVPVGRCICHPELEQPLRGMMRAWEPLERQKTPFEIVALEPEKEIELKNNISMRAIATRHTVPSLGFSVLERRSKLKEEFRDLPQEKLRELDEGLREGHLAGSGPRCRRGWSSSSRFRCRRCR
jgi:hypothetical protein